MAERLQQIVDPQGVAGTDGVHVVEADDLTDFTAERATEESGPDMGEQSMLRIARLSPESLHQVLEHLVSGMAERAEA